MANRVRKLIQSDWADQIDLVDLNDDNLAPVLSDQKCIGLGDSLEPSEVIQKAVSHDFRQIVQNESVESDSEIQVSAKMLCEGGDFVKHPLSSILEPGKIDSETENHLTKVSFDFQRSDQKTDLLSELRDYVATLMKRESMISEVLSVADEIFSNAIFNAPFVNATDHKGTSRGDGVVVADKSAQFLAGDNGTRLALGVVDKYGSLDVSRLLKKIEQTYKEGPEKTIQLSGEGGAGLGTYMVFESCLSLFIVVKPGEYTVVGVTMPIKMSRREKATSPKNLHCLEIAP